jgi:hypothetical protein
LEGILASCLDALDVQGFPSNAPARSPTCRWFREVSHYFFCSSDGINGKAVDQRTGHLVAIRLQSCFLQYGAAAWARCFSDHSGSRLFAGLAAQPGHVSDRDNGIPPSRAFELLKGEACHFINDGLFLTAG